MEHEDKPVFDVNEIDRYDIMYWFPILLATGVPVPETIIIDAGQSLDSIVDGPNDRFDSAKYKDFIKEIEDAARKMGQPCFLRTGHTSGKHDWNRTCYVADISKIAAHVPALVEFSGCVDIMGLPTSTWAVRKFLPIAVAIRTNMGMPVTRERRYWIRDGEVLGHHPYWPPKAVERKRPFAKNWREILDQINNEPLHEVELLSERSRLVSKSFTGAWSLDWLKAGMEWYAIDMAPAARSFCWKEHPNAPKEDLNEKERFAV